MAVAELPVVVHLEAAAHAVIPEGEGVDDGVGVLDVLPEEGVKAVLLDAAAIGGAAKAAQTAALEGEVRQVHKAGLVGIEGAEILDHGPEAGILFLQVAHDDGVEALRLHTGAQGLNIGGAVRNRPGCGRRLKHSVFHAVDRITEKILRLPAALLRQQVLHIGGKAVDDAHAHVPAVLLQIAVGGDVKEVLGGGQLGGIDIFKVRAAALHQLQKAVQLGGGQEGIDRVGKQQKLR